MGLLSDPEYGSAKWVKILRKIQGPLCFLFYIGAIGWFLMLGNRDFNNETYFSENALLPGLVAKEFNAESSANRFYSELLQEMEGKYEETGEMPVSWLVGKMSQLHLEVYTHNFTLNYPMGQGQVYKGTNVYGILRAARTPSLEALVVSAPFRYISTHQKGTAAGIALMLAFAQFARPQKYWAKDIIFLITEYEQLGMQAWLEAYHGLDNEPGNFYTSLGSFWRPDLPMLDLAKFTSPIDWGEDAQSLNPGKLQGRSGSIQAAINLEFDSPKIKYIEVKIEGLNGQLPNLDLVNLVHKLCVKSGIHHSYKNSYSWIRRNKMDEWLNGIWTMLGMVNTQFPGVPNGNHGLFHRFGIEAVTLEGRDANDPAGIPPKVNSLPTASFYKLGTALESILRSLNNLLERFHQSYFFYLLASTNRFISIGQYMPSLCLLCAAMLIRALSLWVNIQDDEKDTQNDTLKDKAKKDNSAEETEKHKISKDKVSEEVKDELESDGKLEKDDEKEDLISKDIDDVGDGFSVVNMGANYLLVHLLGYIVMNSPVIFSQIGAKYFEYPSEFSVYCGFIAVSVVIVIISPFLPRLFRSGPLTREEMTIMNILVLIELSTACLAIGMHNFSLGLVVATVYTPLSLVVGVIDNKRTRSIILQMKRIMCLLLHPLCFLSLAMISYSHVLFPEEGLGTMISRGKDAAMQAVMFSIVDSMIYGNWLYNVGTCILFPTWIIFWQILCNKVEID
ncbi:Glycosylphosphatidylinositol anchor attachment 1 protein [Papilio xuthus]|uniref:Glycosylphosphatidylinositol anchor attachment 1 protein n=1 Tax=Papilio xuthus TaxID=66420 RepID=A0A194Q6Y9_PAPXU|nr:Glycosylphosphatidylinositol anchor attachment 1 protein [Papilio xuthus]